MINARLALVKSMQAQTKHSLAAVVYSSTGMSTTPMYLFSKYSPEGGVLRAIGPVFQLLSILSRSMITLKNIPLQ